MSILVLITVAGNSWQFIHTFLKHETKQVQDTIQMQAEKAANQFQSEIEAWKNQIAVALPTLQGIGQEEAPAQIKKFVNSSSEFVSFEILEAPHVKSSEFRALGAAFTSNTSDPRFEDKVPAEIWDKNRTIVQNLLKREVSREQPPRFVVETLAKELKLPIMIFALRFDVEKSANVVWAVLTTWQTNLIKVLPKSRYLDSAVIDDTGKVFSAPNIFSMVNRSSYLKTPLVRTALSGVAPSGFQNQYVGIDKNRKLGAFARLPKYDLTVIIEKDAEAAFETLKRNLISTALWAFLFILVAVAFSLIGAAGITKGLRAVTYATGRIAAGDFNYRITPSTKDEVGLLGLAVNHMSNRIVSLLRAQVDKARFEKELETAKMVQSTFFPKGDISSRHVLVTGFYQPASECGGDLWGHFEIEKGVDFIFIADAMGHGAPAALVTAMAYSTCMTIADLIRDYEELRDSPAKILGRLNRIIYEAVSGSISMTFFAAIIDTNTAKMTYANAGHNFPVLLPQDPNDPRAGRVPKSFKKISEIPPVSLKLKGTPLGMDPKTKFKEATIDLQPGDKIFFFTDGLIECCAPDGSVWGRKHLLENILEVAKASAEDIKNSVITKAFDFFGDRALDDDVTVVVVEVSKDWQPGEQPVMSVQPKDAPKLTEGVPVSNSDLPKDGVYVTVDASYGGQGGRTHLDHPMEINGDGLNLLSSRRSNELPPDLPPPPVHHPEDNQSIPRPPVPKVTTVQSEEKNSSAVVETVSKPKPSTNPKGRKANKYKIKLPSAG